MFKPPAVQLPAAFSVIILSESGRESVYRNKNINIMYIHDNRIVITLDAGGTNLVFGAMRGCE